MTTTQPVVLVDWLGRAGIAQCTEAWALELRDAGHQPIVVTRPGRELGTGLVPASTPARVPRGRIGAHRAVVQHAVRVIREQRPQSVVIQNYLLPPIEKAVHRAAREVGARVVFVIHDHRMHTVVAGTRWGLQTDLGAADVVVAHTPFVAEHIARATGRSDIRVVPLPRLRGMLDERSPTRPLIEAGTDPLALHFGVLRRRYKGSGTVAALARQGVAGWRFGFVGAGASRVGVAPELAVDRFVEPGELVATVESSDVTLLPYRLASQSGAVVLAQALGSVVLASGVGGIPDQVADGRTGVLLPAGAPLTAWAEALADLRDAGRRRELADAARRRLDEEHQRFVQAIRDLAA